MVSAVATFLFLNYQEFLLFDCKRQIWTLSIALRNINPYQTMNN